jgi:outer membrane protein TolC
MIHLIDLWIRRCIPCAALISSSLLCPASTHAETLSLSTVLKLAGANATEVQLAEAKLAEARGVEQQRVLGFFPSVSVGIGYKAHHGQLQDIVGNVFTADKQSATLGPAATLDLPIGEAIYKRLAAKQAALAAEKDVESQRLITQARAVVAYFDLVQAQAMHQVAQEAVRISENYGKQVTNAVTAGVAFKGDALRVQVQTQKNQLVADKAMAAIQQSGVTLAQILRLEQDLDLRATESEPTLLTLASNKGGAQSLAAKAKTQRPEFAKQIAALAAAHAERDAAVKGPWVPTLTAQTFTGGLAGGIIGGDSAGMRSSQDYFVGLSWKIGAGGLFDKGRKAVAEAKLKQAELEQQRLDDAVTAEVTSLYSRCKTLATQVATAKKAVAAAEENNKLTHERQDFAVGVVLETILAEQELTQARMDYLKAVTEHNAAQYLLSKAIGE